MKNLLRFIFALVLVVSCLPTFNNHQGEQQTNTAYAQALAENPRDDNAGPDDGSVPENQSLHLEAEKDSVTANGNARTKITASFIDANGQLVRQRGTKVHFSTTMGKLSNPIAKTNPTGRAFVFLIAAPITGTATITAQSADLESNPVTVTFVDNGNDDQNKGDEDEDDEDEDIEISDINVVASPEVIVANGVSTTTITITAAECNNEANDDNDEANDDNDEANNDDTDANDSDENNPTLATFNTGDPGNAPENPRDNSDDDNAPEEPRDDDDRDDTDEPRDDDDRDDTDEPRDDDDRDDTDEPRDDDDRDDTDDRDDRNDDENNMPSDDLKLHTTLGTLNTSTIELDNACQASVILTAETHPGTAIVTVASGRHRLGSALVDMLPAENVYDDKQPTAVNIHAQNDELVANGHGKTKITAWLLDDQGKPLRMRNETITFTTTMGSFRATSETSGTVQTITATTGPTGKAIAFLTADIVTGTAEITAISGDLEPATDTVAFVIRSNDKQAKGRINHREGGRVTSPDGMVDIQLPEDALDEDADIICTNSDDPLEEGVAMPGVYNQFVPLGHFISLNARTNNGRHITRFNKAITIQIYLAVENITLLYWNGESWVDPTAEPWCQSDECGQEFKDGVLEVTVDHFSQYALFQGPTQPASTQSVYLPLITR